MTITATIFFCLTIIFAYLFWMAERARGRFHDTTLSMQRLMIVCRQENRAPTHEEYISSLMGEYSFRDTLGKKRDSQTFEKRDSQTFEKRDS